jgi:hypothetical protein
MEHEHEKWLNLQWGIFGLIRKEGKPSESLKTERKEGKGISDLENGCVGKGKWMDSLIYDEKKEEDNDKEEADCWDLEEHEKFSQIHSYRTNEILLFKQISLKDWK